MILNIFNIIVFSALGYASSTSSAGVQVPEWLKHSSSAQADCREHLKNVSKTRRHIFKRPTDVAAFERVVNLSEGLSDPEIQFLKTFSWSSATRTTGLESVTGRMQANIGTKSERIFYSRASISVVLADPAMRNFSPRMTFQLSFRRPNSVLPANYQDQFDRFCLDVFDSVLPGRCTEQGAGPDRLFTVEMRMDKWSSDVLMTLRDLNHALEVDVRGPALGIRFLAH